MNTVIVASGSLTPCPGILERINQADLIIAADGGASHLYRLGITPDAVLGDMDSISSEARAAFESRQVPFVCHPEQKDQTDTELCIDHALAKGADRITLIGATGARLDHTLANVFLLKRLNDANVRASLLDDHNEIFLVEDSLDLEGCPGDILSLIPISETVTGITLENLAYPLHNADLSMGTAMGVSNRFLGNQARITIKTGMVLVTLSQD